MTTGLFALDPASALCVAVLSRAWGSGSKDRYARQPALAVDAVAVFLTALIEEGEMKARFGDEYAAYMKTTKRFVPFVF